MPIQVTCHCGQPMTVDDQFAGHPVSCIQCGQSVQVPASAAVTAAYTPPSTAASPEETAPTLAVPSGSFQTQEPTAADPPAPEPPAPRQGKGNRRRTFVADWAQGMAEQWADEHADQIASDQRPSTLMCFIAGFATIVIGGFNSFVFGLVLLGSLAAAALDTRVLTEGGGAITVIGVFTVLALWTLISGITCMARKRGGASAAIPLNLVWAFLAMFTMFQVQLASVKLDFWLFFVGVVLLCCLGTVLSLAARTQATRYQLWLVRQQQEADGTLNP